MHRTNVYLTAEQERALDRRARQEGTTRSAVLRAIIDRDLSRRPSLDPEVAAGFAEVADLHDDLAGTLFDDDPDLRIDR